MYPVSKQHIADAPMPVPMARGARGPIDVATRRLSRVSDFLILFTPTCSAHGPALRRPPKIPLGCSFVARPMPTHALSGPQDGRLRDGIACTIWSVPSAPSVGDDIYAWAGVTQPLAGAAASAGGYTTACCGCAISPTASTCGPWRPWQSTCRHPRRRRT